MTEERSRAPWIADRSAWGRIRLTEKMWAANYIAVRTYLNAKWKIHHELPNPSPESRKSMDEIRELQKVVNNLEGLQEEKGWELPTTHGTDGTSRTPTVAASSSTPSSLGSPTTTTRR